MVLDAFGIYDISPVQVSQVLRRLRVSHTVLGGQPKPIQYDVDGLSHEQPVWPVIVDKVKNIARLQNARSPSVLFVCDGLAALNFTNISKDLWAENRTSTLEESVRAALIRTILPRGRVLDNVPSWKLAVVEPAIADYVRAAVKPSFLNCIQALFHKITPYAKSKETRTLCIAYLAGGIGIAALRRYLKTSLKFADLLVLMDSAAALNLRAAVAALKSKPIETVAQEFGVETFELLYIVKSYQQHRVPVA
jgi:hypothetical protein